jgi:chorismate mutase
VAEPSADAILSATERLLATLLQRNGIASEDVVSAFFTATDDLVAAFPAEAARRMGLGAVPPVRP